MLLDEVRFQFSLADSSRQLGRGVGADDPAGGADHAGPESAHVHTVAPVIGRQDGLVVAQLMARAARAWLRPSRRPRPPRR